MNKRDIAHIIEQTLRDTDIGCLIPGCKRTPIKSHTIQKSRYLRDISKNDQVYCIRPVPITKQLFKNTAKSFEINKVNIKTFSVFSGLCSNHDDSLFSCIEKQTPNFTDFNHCFLFSYRSAIREYYWRKRNYEIIEQLLEQLEFDDEAAVKELVTPYLSAEYYLRPVIKKYHFYNTRFCCLKSKLWDCIVVKCSDVPRIVVSDSFFEIERTDTKNVKYITMNVLNDDNGLVVIFFFFRKNRKLVENFLKGRLGDNFQTEISLRRLSSLILCRSELFCINPDVYENMSRSKKNVILDAFSDNMDINQWKLHDEINFWESCKHT